MTAIKPIDNIHWTLKAREMYPLGTPRVQGVQYARFESAQRKLAEMKARKAKNNDSKTGS